MGGRGGLVYETYPPHGGSAGKRCLLQTPAWFQNTRVSLSKPSTTKRVDADKKRKKKRRRGRKKVSTTASSSPKTKRGKKDKSKMTGTKDSSTGQPTLKSSADGLDTTQPSSSKSKVKKASDVETTPHSSSKPEPSTKIQNSTKSQASKSSDANTTPQVKSNSLVVKPGSTNTTARGNSKSTRNNKEITKDRPAWQIVHSLTPLSFVVSKANDITNCPWISGEAFAAVYTWLYSSKTEAISKGVARVAAWGTRGKLPVGIEVTACLCEALLMEVKHNASNSYQVMSFGYSIAITRFINGLVEACLDRRTTGIGITSAAYRFDVPLWVVSLRHEACHDILPSAGRLRAGATFCLRWLKHYYWRQYEVIQNHHGVESHPVSPAPEPSVGQPVPLFARPADVELVSAIPSSDGSAIWRLTQGLCNTRQELVDLLTSSSYDALAKHLLKRQLLQFPDKNSTFVLKAPEASDLGSFAELEVGSADLALWKKHLLKTCEQNAYFKQTLTTALIIVVNSSECEAGLRDYLCSWLCLLMVEQYQVEAEESHGMEVVQIIDDDEQFLPGNLDWLALLKVVKKHPGYYSYAIVNVILQHLKSTLAESTRDKILYLSTLVTLSDRISHASYIPGVRKGAYDAEFKQARAKFLRKRNEERSSIKLPPAKRARLERRGNKTRWSTAADMSQWVRCPLGLAPGQTSIFPTALDLPASLDGQTSSDSAPVTSTSIIHDDKGQDAEDGEKEECQPKDDLFDSMTIVNIQNQVTLF